MERVARELKQIILPIPHKAQAPARKSVINFMIVADETLWITHYLFQTWVLSLIGSFDFLINGGLFACDLNIVRIDDVLLESEKRLLILLYLLIFRRRCWAGLLFFGFVYAVRIEHLLAYRLSSVNNFWE